MTKTFKKSNKDKQVRVAKTLSATLAIGKIEKDTDTFILTYGQFSLIDALLSILDQIGPSHVTVCTWTAAHAHLERSSELMGTADILSFKMIVDQSFKARQPGYYAKMVELFGVDCIRVIKTHAKFITIKNDKFNIVVRTSMNLNENPRLENIEISENKSFYYFFEKIVKDIFEEVKPNQQKNKPPDLNSIEQCELFKLVDGKYIQRNTTNEPRYSHTLNR